MTYELLEEEGRPAIRCLVCGLVSHHPDDVDNLYCGRCHKFHGDDDPPEPEAFDPDDNRYKWPEDRK